MVVPGNPAVGLDKLLLGKDSVEPYGTLWLASGASRTALLSGRPVIGGSGCAQRCDAVNVVKSGESGEEHLCAEARR